MTGRIATAIVTATLTAALAAQQPQQPVADPALPDVTFTVDVNYVEVDAVVTDAAGMPVRNLTVRGAYSHSARIPGSDLPPGDYVFELEARSLIEPVRSVKRQLEIRVHE